MFEKNEQKTKALASAIALLEKEQGKGSVMMLGGDKHQSVQGIPTGSMALNEILGIGGIPRSRVIEVYGPESSGKTTIALTAIASVQRLGGTAAFVDVEHALDPEWAGKLGVKNEDLIFSQPDSGDDALKTVERLVSSGGVDLVVVDSVAALLPRAELEGEIGDSHVGLQARLMSQALRKLTAIIKQTGTTVIFINQIRMKIGTMPGQSPETTSGGNALKFYASVRMDVRRIGQIKKGDEVIGNQTRIKIVKNKVAPPFRNCEVALYFNRGFCQADEAFELAVKKGLIDKSGTWFAWGDLKMQGKQAFTAHLLTNPELLDKLIAEVTPDKKAKPKAGDKTAAK